MQRWGDIASEGRTAILERDYGRLNRLIDENFDLRSKIYNVGQGNLDMVLAARRAGASSNFAGSGGAVVGLYEDEPMFTRLQEEMRALNVVVVKPRIT